MRRPSGSTEISFKASDKKYKLKQSYNAVSGANAALGMRRGSSDGDFCRHDALVIEGGQT